MKTLIVELKKQKTKRNVQNLVPRSIIQVPIGEDGPSKIQLHNQQMVKKKKQSNKVPHRPLSNQFGFDPQTSPLFSSIPIRLCQLKRRPRDVQWRNENRQSWVIGRNRFGSQLIRVIRLWISFSSLSHCSRKSALVCWCFCDLQKCLCWLQILYQLYIHATSGSCIMELEMRLAPSLPRFFYTGSLVINELGVRRCAQTRISCPLFCWLFFFPGK